jgi:hypothetical protein
VFPARYELNSYIVFRKRLVSKRLSGFSSEARTEFTRFVVQVKFSDLVDSSVERINTFITIYDVLLSQ